MDMESTGRLLLAAGIGLVILGGLLLLVGRLPFLGQLGSLPGDIRIEGRGFSCFIPVVSMLLISIIATVVLNILIRLINR